MHLHIELALKRETAKKKANGESVFSSYYTFANTRMNDDVQQQQQH